MIAATNTPAPVGNHTIEAISPFLGSVVPIGFMSTGSNLTVGNMLLVLSSQGVVGVTDGDVATDCILALSFCIVDAAVVAGEGDGDGEGEGEGKGVTHLMHLSASISLAAFSALTKRYLPSGDLFDSENTTVMFDFRSTHQRILFRRPSKMYSFMLTFSSTTFDLSFSQSLGSATYINRTADEDHWIESD